MSRRIPPTPVAAPWNGSTALGWLCDSTLNASPSPPPTSTTPAFSPGPISTYGPSVGSRRSSLRECLYAQCSDHIKDNIASSVSPGTRPRRSTIRSYSESVRPSARWRESVLLAIAAGERSDGDAVGNLVPDRLKQQQAVGRARQRIDGVLGMWHQPEHVPGLVTDAGDVAQRPVGVVAGRISQQHPAVGFELAQLCVGRVEASGRVLDRDREAMAVAASARERGISAHDLEVDLAKDELQRGVREQRPGKQAGLAQNLEAVADPEHDPAGASELGYLLHHRRKARDRSGAQVIAVREAARHDHRVDALQIPIGVPQDHRLAGALCGTERVNLVAGSREADDSELHAEPSSSADPVSTIS